MNLLFLTYDKTDACSFYRSAGIASDLRKRTGYDITTASWKDINLDWATLMQFDIIMIQRPYTSQSRDLCQYIKSLRITLWIDYDDNLFAVPVENKAYHIYGDPTSQRNIKDILNLADVVSVTNDELRASYLEYNSNIHVIPNAFNDSLFNRKLWQERSKLVVWRGSDTHILDIWQYAQAISQASEEKPDYQFLFWGYEPFSLSQTKNKGYMQGMDIILYHSNLEKMKPLIMQIPLQDSIFNRCKSNIAAIEGTFAGAVSIVPEWWNIPGALKYDSQESYYSNIKAVLSGEIDVKKQNAISWEYVQDYLSLSKVNQQRVELIKSLI